MGQEEKPSLVTRYAFFLVGLFSFVWLLFRTGMKPIRITYPCQQTSAATASLWFSIYVLPLVGVVKTIRSNRTCTTLLIAGSIFLIAAGISIGAYTSNLTVPLSGAFDTSGGGGTQVKATATFDQGTSDIFAIHGMTGDNGGMETLIRLMEQNGLQFYNISGNGYQNGSGGLLGTDDVVIIKVNCKWDERGGTNSDLVKAVIRSILDHPQGFNGEIVIADNGQGTGSMDWEMNNAEIIGQSLEEVASTFAESHRVSTYLWDNITTIQVREYEEGDLNDGYVVNTTPNPRTRIRVSYPKFTTKYGTKVSLKMGIWDQINESYNEKNLKLINIPVFKSHSEYGVTGAVKHYMGIGSNSLTSFHGTVDEGGMGTEMVETRFPTLTILDAIWINAHPGSGPATHYTLATRVNVIAASTDPVALDAWAARSILIPEAEALGYSDVSSINPDYRVSGSFGRWLELSMEELRIGGYSSTMENSSIKVHATTIIDGVQPLPGCSNSPTDTDSDGIIEDLNGNTRADFADIVMFFDQMDWVSANEPIVAFDFNRNGRIDFNDIVRLFEKI